MVIFGLREWKIKKITIKISLSNILKYKFIKLIISLRYSKVKEKLRLRKRNSLKNFYKNLIYLKLQKHWNISKKSVWKICLSILLKVNKILYNDLAANYVYKI